MEMNPKHRNNGINALPILDIVQFDAFKALIRLFQFIFDELGNTTPNIYYYPIKGTPLGMIDLLEM